MNKDSSIKVVELKIKLKLTKKWNLKKGFEFLNVFRSIYGMELRAISCKTSMPKCKGCLLYGKCTYSYLFETPILNKKHDLLRGYEFAPHPVVIKPVINKEFNGRDKFILNLTFMGKAIEHIHIFILNLMNFCEIYYIESINNDKNELIYVSGDNQLKEFNVDRVISIPSLRKDKILDGEYIVKFKTPYRYYIDGKHSSKITPVTLAKQINRRMVELFICHGEMKNAPTKNDLFRFFEKSSSIEIVEERLIKNSISRISYRQKRKMPFGGITGFIKLKNISESYYETLKMMELFSIGKATSFGYGQVTISKSNEKKLINNKEN